MKFAIFTKTFRDDLRRFLKLLSSVEEFNVERIPYYISVPSADRQLFLDAIGSRQVHVLTDEEILGSKLTQSWKGQQLVKLQVWRTGFADAWFWFDSDSYFIRDFTVADFIRNDGSVALPASRSSHVLDTHWESILAYMDDPSAFSLATAAEIGCAPALSLRAIPAFQRVADALRRPSHDTRLLRIARFFGRTGCPLHYLPGAIWTRTSLSSFEEQVLAPFGMSYEDLLRFSPWEGVWIGEWEVASGMRGRHAIESPLLHISSDKTIHRARAAGLTESRLAARYLGIQLAARHQLLESLDET